MQINNCCFQNNTNFKVTWQQCWHHSLPQIFYTVASLPSSLNWDLVSSFQYSLNCKKLSMSFHCLKYQLKWDWDQDVLAYLFYVISLCSFETYISSLSGIFSNSKRVLNSYLLFFYVEVVQLPYYIMVVTIHILVPNFTLSFQL